MLKKFLIIIILLGALAPSLYAVNSRAPMLTQIAGGDEVFTADVVEIGDGTKGLVVSSSVTVNENFGADQQANAWAFIGTQDDATGVGAAGDTVTTTIAAATTPLDTPYPAVSVVTTVTAGMVADDNPERLLAEQICDDLGADANFIKAWECIVMRDYSGIFIHSKFFNEFGQRKGCIPITDCFNMVATGTTVMTPAFNSILIRGLVTELTRSPNNPRAGVLAIAGSISVVPGGAGNLLFEELENAGSPSMLVDGSVTPIAFRVECDSVFDKYINVIRFFGACGTMKLTQWTCSNSALTNGIMTTIRSEAIDLILLPLKTTQDIINKFAIGPAGPTGQARLDDSQAGDGFTADFSFPQAALIKKCGTNGTGTDDYIEMEINDDMTGAAGGNMSELEVLVSGFRRAP